MQEAGGNAVGAWGPLARAEGSAGARAALGGELSRLVFSRLGTVPDIRLGLVELLRREVNENRYFVPSERVAERMISCFLASHLN